jgi:Putative adhesin
LQHRTRSYSVTGPVPTLVVDAHVGGVRVTGDDSAKISVTEHISFRHTVPVTTHRVTAGTLALDSNCPAGETCGVAYNITVPRSVTVQVSDRVGTIRLSSLSGQVTAQTDAGDVDLASVSGPVNITGMAASILGQNVSSARASLRVTAGTIEVTFSAAPASLTAAATAGSVTLRVPGGVPYAVDASASVGSTQVSALRSAASPHAITAWATTGSVTIEPAP